MSSYRSHTAPVMEESGQRLQQLIQQHMGVNYDPAPRPTYAVNDTFSGQTTGGYVAPPAKEHSFFLPSIDLPFILNDETPLLEGAKFETQPWAIRIDNLCSATHKMHNYSLPNTPECDYALEGQWVLLDLQNRMLIHRDNVDIVLQAISGSHEFAILGPQCTLIKEYKNLESIMSTFKSRAANMLDVNGNYFLNNELCSVIQSATEGRYWAFYMWITNISYPYMIVVENRQQTPLASTRLPYQAQPPTPKELISNLLKDVELITRPENSWDDPYSYSGCMIPFPNRWILAGQNTGDKVLLVPPAVDVHEQGSTISCGNQFICLDTERRSPRMAWRLLEGISWAGEGGWTELLQRQIDGCDFEEDEWYKYRKSQSDDDDSSSEEDSDIDSANYDYDHCDYDEEEQDETNEEVIEGEGEYTNEEEEEEQEEPVNVNADEE